jgi:hypothetical protein
MDPALAVTYIIAAAALCLERTTPLGLVLLAPVAVIIFFTDTLRPGATSEQRALLA